MNQYDSLLADVSLSIACRRFACKFTMRVGKARVAPDRRVVALRLFSGPSRSHGKLNYPISASTSFRHGLDSFRIIITFICAGQHTLQALVHFQTTAARAIQHTSHPPSSIFTQLAPFRRRRNAASTTEALEDGRRF